MSLNEWLRCPAGCDATITAVTLAGSRVGLQCVACGRKIEEPVEQVEENYRTVEH